MDECGRLKGAQILITGLVGSFFIFFIFLVGFTISLGVICHLTTPV